MKQRELHLSICYKLYLFIMKTLASQALKTVTLGRPSHYGSTSTHDIHSINDNVKEINKSIRSHSQSVE
ncbi:hypothetical protein CR513_37078, partial [Mucuna pruriens]